MCLHLLLFKVQITQRFASGQRTYVCSRHPAGSTRPRRCDAAGSAAVITAYAKFQQTAHFWSRLLFACAHPFNIPPSPPPPRPSLPRNHQAVHSRWPGKSRPRQGLGGAPCRTSRGQLCARACSARAHRPKRAERLWVARHVPGQALMLACPQAAARREGRPARAPCSAPRSRCACDVCFVSQQLQTAIHATSFRRPLRPGARSPAGRFRAARSLARRLDRLTRAVCGLQRERERRQRRSLLRLGPLGRDARPALPQRRRLTPGAAPAPRGRPGPWRRRRRPGAPPATPPARRPE